MYLIKQLNRFIFQRTFNPFDILTIFVITSLIAESFWWLALYIPAMIFSCYMQELVEYGRD